MKLSGRLVVPVVAVLLLAAAAAAQAGRAYEMSPGGEGCGVDTEIK